MNRILVCLSVRHIRTLLFKRTYSNGFFVVKYFSTSDETVIIPIIIRIVFDVIIRVCTVRRNIIRVLTAVVDDYFFSAKRDNCTGITQILLKREFILFYFFHVNTFVNVLLLCFEITTRTRRCNRVYRAEFISTHFFYFFFYFTRTRHIPIT